MKDILVKAQFSLVTFTLSSKNVVIQRQLNRIESTQCTKKNMTSDETQIQTFADWPMSHAIRGPKGNRKQQEKKNNRKNPEYHVVAAIRKLRTDKNCPAEKLLPHHVKNDQHMGSKKPTAPKILDSLNITIWVWMISRSADYFISCYTVFMVEILGFQFQFGLYHVVVPSSLLCSISLASLFSSLSIFG